MLNPFDIFAGFGAVFSLLAILAFVFWVWMLVDCLQNLRLQGTEKVVWVLVIVFLHFLGALVYFFIERDKRV